MKIVYHYFKTRKIQLVWVVYLKFWSHWGKKGLIFPQLLLITSFCTLLCCESLSYGCVVGMHFLIQLDTADSSCDSSSWLCLATHNLLVGGISEWVFLMNVHTIKHSWHDFIRRNYLNLTLACFTREASDKMSVHSLKIGQRTTNPRLDG